MALLKKNSETADSTELVRGDTESRRIRLDGELVERAWSAQNSVTRRPMLADKELLHVNSGLSLEGKKRILLTFVLDGSMSMQQEMYAAVCQGLNRFAEVMMHEKNLSCAGVSIISIERSQIRLLRDFQSCTAGLGLTVSESPRKGMSPVISAAYLASQRSIRRKENYAHGGIQCYSPVVVVFSDFRSNDCRYSGIDEAALQAMIQEMNEQQDVHIFKAYTENGSSLLNALQGAEISFVQGENALDETVAVGFLEIYRQLCEVIGITLETEPSAEDFLIEK